MLGALDGIIGEGALNYIFGERESKLLSHLGSDINANTDLLMRKEEVTMKIRDEYTCPLEIVHDLVKGKWKTIIVFQLKDGNTSLSQLNRDIVGISEKMLLQHLNELQRYGVVDKINAQGYPLRVEYFLTDRGKKLSTAINIMQEIGIEYMVEHGQTDWLERKDIPYQKDS